MTPIKTILHPTDFSCASTAAFGLACSLAQAHKARLVVLHVLERPMTVYPGVMTPEPAPPPSEQERSSRRKQLEAIAAEDADIRLEHLFKEGEPAPEILGVAGDIGAGLIVMGTHGRTGLKHLLMGSVAETIVRQAHTPVMIVKAPQPG